MPEELKEMLKGIKSGDIYYYIRDDGTICPDVWRGYDVDRMRYAFGNFFKDPKKAQITVVKVKAVLIFVRDERGMKWEK